ncbi:AfsR/SARP family transcriptional regulator [Allorhizocola rhizosphaerae]|uniref:AfsR/SARP family transcriptional regulator n=1 Tax=Allorhizocola rhizosphaerae TaxID=1872709 RepID=UPI000E3D87E2|nr:AfsR/SARP family transcriptional regulator [Allorhizocola rhizosphaerae]
MFGILGQLAVTVNGELVSVTGLKKQRMLSCLLLSPNAVVSTDSVIEAIWEDNPPDTAVRQVRNTASGLRQLIGGRLETAGTGYRLRVEPDELDALRFDRLVAEADAASDRAEQVSLLRRALALWRGPALEGIDSRSIRAGARYWDNKYLACLERCLEAELELGRHAEMAAELTTLVDRFPFREGFWYQLMLALYRSGQPDAALAAYQDARRRLDEELGIAPGPRLDDLQQQILRRDRKLDLSEQAPVPMQLPPPAGYFTDRRAEVAQLHESLGQVDESQIALIAGQGGIGKTALAVHIAHQVKDRFPDGQIFLDLRGHDPQRALTASDALLHVLRSLSVTGSALPSDLDGQINMYRSLTTGKRLLIIGDNAHSVEQILPLVPSDVSSFLILTSRHRLGPLTLRHAVCRVTLDVLDREDSLDLMRRVVGPRLDAEPEAARELVTHCGGLPLAVRLIAARLSSRTRLPLATIAEQLREQDTRIDMVSQDSGSFGLRSVFDASYHALSEPAARAFRLLGLHPGPSFCIHLAASLTGTSPAHSGEILDEIAEAHLLNEVAAGRYAFHDLVRIYAADRARPMSDLDSALHRLRQWYLGLAALANQTLTPQRTRVQAAPLDFDPPGGLLAFLDTEQPNFVPFVQHAEAQGDVTAAWHFGYLMNSYFLYRGHAAESIPVHQVALRAAHETSNPVAISVASKNLGVAYRRARNPQAAIGHFTVALEAEQRVGDQRAVGFTLSQLGIAYTDLGRYIEALATYRTAIDVLTRAGDRRGLGVAYNNLGELHLILGHDADGDKCVREALAIARELGDQRDEAIALTALGNVHIRRSEYDTAITTLHTALELQRAIGENFTQAETLCGLGAAYLGRGDTDAGLRRLREAASLARRTGDERWLAHAQQLIDATHADPRSVHDYPSA